MGKTCTPCAATGRLTWRPCGNHDTAADPATCSHELTSYVFTHNGANDAYKCHTCGTMLTELDNTFDRATTLHLLAAIPQR